MIDVNCKRHDDPRGNEGCYSAFTCVDKMSDTLSSNCCGTAGFQVVFVPRSMHLFAGKMGRHTAMPVRQSAPKHRWTILENAVSMLPVAATELFTASKGCFHYHGLSCLVFI